MLDFFFPRRCIGCNREGGWLCPECLFQLKDEMRLPRTEDFPSYRLVWQADHAGLVREVLHSFKYHSLSVLAESIVGAIDTEKICQLAPSGRVGLIPVPVSRSRLKERGFNQAERLATAWSRYLPESGVMELLKKTNQKGSQVGKTAGERRVQAGKSFVWNDKAELPDNLVLIDDVYTTGSTAEACLERFPQGESKPTVLVIARA